MILTHLEIHGLRNLNDVAFTPNARFNLIIGPNGAGKSSILEAIHCLSAGHSYRTKKARELIAYGAEEFTLSCQMQDPLSKQTHRSGLRRSKGGLTELRLDYEEVRSMATVTQILPVKAITPDSHRLIQEGPTERRQFIDWGTFHAEPFFFESWKQFRRALAQRNQALKDVASDQEVLSWDDSLIEAGEALNEYRRKYCGNLQFIVSELLDRMQALFHVELRYKSGWSESVDLHQALQKSFQNCRRFKTTTVGPHRAELLIEADGILAKQVLSRGQQKLLVYALHIAQVIALNNLGKRSAIILCDDLPSELDHMQCGKVLEQLADLPSQVFLSCTSKPALPPVPFSIYSIQSGALSAT